MDGTSGDQQFLSDRRVTNLPSDLEFHLAFQDDDQFVGRMREVFPSLTWRVGPEVATEIPVSPNRQRSGLCLLLVMIYPPFGMSILPRPNDYGLLSIKASISASSL